MRKGHDAVYIKLMPNVFMRAKAESLHAPDRFKKADGGGFDPGMRQLVRARGGRRKAGQGGRGARRRRPDSGLMTAV